VILGIVALAPAVASAGARYNDNYDNGEPGFVIYVGPGYDYYDYTVPDLSVVEASDGCESGYYGCYLSNRPYYSTRR
jgi:hypothetical protein